MLNAGSPAPAVAAAKPCGGSLGQLQDLRDDGQRTAIELALDGTAAHPQLDRTGLSDPQAAAGAGALARQSRLRLPAVFNRSLYPPCRARIDGPVTFDRFGPAMIDELAARAGRSGTTWKCGREARPVGTMAHADCSC